jgi:hypothetical protein
MMPQLESFAEEALGSSLGDWIPVIEAAPLPSLGAGPLVPSLTEMLSSPRIGSAGQELPRERRSLCESGLWLLAGDLDRSHRLSQEIDSADGSFWHGIMHRREGDFGNAKYWFRRVGSHPVLRWLAESPGGYADPFQFVDRCRGVGSDDDDDDYRDCQRIQWLEWQALMSHCVGGQPQS